MNRCLRADPGRQLSGKEVMEAVARRTGSGTWAPSYRESVTSAGPGTLYTGKTGRLSIVSPEAMFAYGEQDQ